METASQGADRPLVLVADDDPAVRSLFEQTLVRQGLAVVLAANGREAIEQLARHEVDLALFDVNMPVLDGLDALREIRADPRHRTLPIILVTASDTESERVRGLESGADDFVSKPVNLNELTARVRAHLRGRSAWRREVERGRDERRRLATALDGLPRTEPLVVVAASLVREIQPILGVDGVAILYFAADSVRVIASSGDLAPLFRAGKALGRDSGREVAARSGAGAWLQNAAARPDPTLEPVDVAYVPFRLGPSPTPLGCLAFGLRPGQVVGPLSHRLPDLIDATDFIVAVLRPAVQQAELTGAATTRLQRVIARQEFEIHLQPIARLDGGELIAVEALTRFRDGGPARPPVRRGGVARPRPRPAACDAAGGPRCDILAAFERRVEPSTCRRMSSCSNPRCRTSLRTSGGSLSSRSTEHERIDDYEAVRSALGRLGPHVKLAIDDAGSGYASLRHILALQPAYVKLDIEWVHNIDRDPVRRALVSGLIYFASETGCELIAEGIETQDELDSLRDLGVRLGQGYLLGHPMPAAEVGRAGTT